ncbi:MAG: BON domain-containing protein, partial [Bryobacteraceae bacterium]|nr:BON domain-containing protein [Bryobacteraceae bacterium]
EVKPVARDEEIRQRLERILRATGWFQASEVEVEEGVVFLNGRTRSEEYKTWAGNLARSTRDVVAVVNRLEVAKSVWDLEPALA